MMPIDGVLVIMLFSALAGFSFGMRCERERCAEIADEHQGFSDCAKNIAAAIRSGK